MSDQKCDLCAGECRGHSLGHTDQWEPEPGSRAYADQSIEQIAREIANKIITQAIEEKLSDYTIAVQAARLALLEGMKLQRERDAGIADAHYNEIYRARDAHYKEGNQEATDRCDARCRSASQIAAAIRSAMP